MRQCAFGSGHMRHESVSCAFSLPCVFVMFLWHVPLARVFGMSLCHGTHGAIFRHLDYGELARFRQITFSHKVASMTMYPFLVKEIYAAGQGDFFPYPPHLQGSAVLRSTFVSYIRRSNLCGFIIYPAIYAALHLTLDAHGHLPMHARTPADKHAALSCTAGMCICHASSACVFSMGYMMGHPAM